MLIEDLLSNNIFRKIAFLVIVLIILFSAVSFASKNDMNTVTIRLSNGTELSVFTSKVKVEDILNESHIIVIPGEIVTPGKDENINASKTIVISYVDDEEVEEAEYQAIVEKEEILDNYAKIVEKIIVEREEIPFETITKDISKSGSETTSSVIQKGKNGLKELKYRVKYKEDVEIERNLISETILQEPVDKIVQISTKIVSRSGMRVPASGLAAAVEGVQPRVVTMNASAYCSCVKCTGSGNGRTASGAIASSWYTLAAGKGIPIGTIVYIPAFANKPNGGWFVVQDRGGAISNNRIDIYMGSHGEANAFGRRNLECYLYY